MLYLGLFSFFLVVKARTSARHPPVNLSLFYKSISFLPLLPVLRQPLFTLFCAVSGLLKKRFRTLHGIPPFSGRSFSPFLKKRIYGVLFFLFHRYALS
jgi:hypothetical protein